MAFAGKLQGKVNLKLLLSIGAGITGAGLILSSFCGHIAGFYLLWAIVGFFSPLLISVALPTLLGNWFPEKMGAMLGIAYGLSGVGGALFNTLVGNLIVNIGWRKALAAEGAITLITLLPFTTAVFQLNPEKNYEKKNKSLTEKTDLQNGISQKNARKMSSFYLFILANLALTIVASLVQQISPHIVSRGYKIQQGALVVSAEMIGCAVGNVSMGWMLDKFRTAQVIGLYAVFGVAGWLGLGIGKNLTMFIVAGVLAGLAQACFQTGIPFCIRKVFGGREYSRIYSEIAFPSSAAAIFSASLGGIIYDVTGSYIPVMILQSLMFAIAGPGMIWAVEKSRKKGEKNYG